jgi:basic membrane protein A
MGTVFSRRSAGAALLLGAVAAAACNPTYSPPPVPAPDAQAASVRTACLVADVGGLDDKSFNQTAFLGVKTVETTRAWNGLAVECRTSSDYVPSIQTFLGKCDFVVTVGFNFITPTQSIGAETPGQKFLLLDSELTPPLPNVWAQTYESDQAAFLAGYIAAATTSTGIVGTFGGLPVAPVQDYMNGFALGVAYYQTKHGRPVKCLGWDPASQKGTFADGFVDTAVGQQVAADLLAQGADVLLPVAGGLGFGAGNAILASGRTAYLIGVDSDWYVEAPEYSAFVLTSVVKRLDLSVVAVATAIDANTFVGGTHASDLASGEVDLAPFHDLDKLVTTQTKDEIAQLRADIAAGKVKTTP